jgi:hypothetical protein
MVRGTFSPLCLARKGTTIARAGDPNTANDWYLSLPKEQTLGKGREQREKAAGYADPAAIE